MKKITFLILLSIFVMIGCQDSSSILEPIADENESLTNLNKKLNDIRNSRLLLDSDEVKILRSKKIISSESDTSDSFGWWDFNKDWDSKDWWDFDGWDDNYGWDGYTGFNWEEFFKKLMSNIGKDNVVLGFFGGVIPFEYALKDGFSVKGQLTIPEGAYYGMKEFAIEFDPETYSAHFYPSPTVFKKPLILDMYYAGLDLTGVDPNTFEFCYLGINGEIEVAEYERMEIDISNGTLFIIGAQLPHFSRYGWTRTK